jgi:catechol 2,3-dioxygenase-like lactoylglutathione lyase family enzyme
MPDQGPAGVHHIAYACRDIEATHNFYEDLMGFELIHTEVERFDNGGYVRHILYDTGDGSRLAFFDIHGVGEREDWSSDISRLFGATDRRAAENTISA